MKQISPFLILLLAIISCKKDPPLQEAPILPMPVVSYPDYGKLAVGNYWIYQRFKVDNAGNYTPLSIYDSCYVTKDTIIAGKTYYEMYRPDSYGPFYTYTRQEGDKLVNNYGITMFSATDFTSIRRGYSTASPTDTIAHSVFKMNNKDSVVTTVAGTFVTSNAQTTILMTPSWSSFTGYSIRHTNRCYAENVGIVVETLKIVFNPAPSYYYERRLVRYHVN
jgi:hypothetical protein